MRVNDPETRALLREHGAEAEAQREMRRWTEELMGLFSPLVGGREARIVAETTTQLVSGVVAVAAAIRWLQAMETEERDPEAWREAVEGRATVLAKLSEVRDRYSQPPASVASDWLLRWAEAKLAIPEKTAEPLPG